MKTIIAGSRTITDYKTVYRAIDASGFKISEVVSGCAQGVDDLGECWAAFFEVPVKRFPADWKTNGKAAGPIRNQQMALYADALIAIKDKPESRGTDDMIRRARKKGLKVMVYQAYDSTLTTSTP